MGADMIRVVIPLVGFDELPSFDDGLFYKRVFDRVSLLLVFSLFVFF